jgi:hypothetical protein
MADSESEDRLKRAASLRRTVAETIARVRRTTAHIGVPRPPSEAEADAEPSAAAPAPASEPPRAESPAAPREAPGESGLGRDVSALLERTRSVIERTRRVIEESRASLARRPDSADGDEDDEKP